MEVTRDRRRDPRVRVKVRIEATDSETGRPHVLHTCNLSIGGARCTTVHPLSDGVLLTGHVFLPLSEAGRDVDVAIPVRGRVLRHHGEGTGSPQIALIFDVMSEADRAELASYLFDWLADDAVTHVDLMAEAGR